MPLQTTKNIWHNGKLIPWESATIHIMSHVVHYGSSIFEGIRAYTQTTPGASETGAAIIRLHEHMQRFRDSGHIYRMPLGFTVPELSQAVIDTVEANGVAPCYIRPVAFRGYGEAGINPLSSPVEVYIANYPWGKYVPGNEGATVCVSSWEPPRAQHHAYPVKGRRQLPQLAAHSHGSRHQRLRRRHRARCQRPALRGLRRKTSSWSAAASSTPRRSPLSVLNGITRNSIFTLAKDLGIPIVEQTLPREFLYICDEAFFTGTAAEVTHLRSVDRYPHWRRLHGPGHEGDPRRVLRHRLRHPARTGTAGSPPSR